MKTLVIDNQKIRNDRGTMRAYARKIGADIPAFEALVHYINKNQSILPTLIKDGYLKIEEPKNTDESAT